MKTPRTTIYALVIALSLAACGPQATPTPPPTPVTVQLRWIHQSQFAGFYAADQNGYYADEGLDVTFIEGGSGVDALTPVLDGTAQFVVAEPARLILERAQGRPLRAIATIYRRSPLVFFAVAGSGISRPQDLVGKTIRLTPDAAATFHAMMARAGISPDQYTEVNVPNDMDALVSGQIPVWGGYVTAFAITVQQAGYKLNFIYPDDYGVHFYADTLFTTDDLIATNPDLARRFLRATLKGWSYAIENPVQIGAMVVKYKPDADAELENLKMIASLPLVNTGEEFIGWMKPEVWAGMEKTLREQNVLTAPLDVTQVYTMQFLEEMYGK